MASVKPPSSTPAGQRPETASAAPATVPSSNLRIGVAGWSYPDWRGIVYTAREARGGDALRAVARLVDLLEINSTFYRVASPRTTENWARAAESFPRLTFTAKVPRTISHERQLERAQLEAVCDEFAAGLAPLREAGRLDTVLLQLPPFFAASASILDRIDRVVERLRPLHTVVEVRHRSFLALESHGDDPVPPFLRFLEERGAGFVNVDLPAGHTQLPPTTINTSPMAYVRLHGRNRDAWFRRDAGRDEKYDYLYAATELDEWVRRIRELAARALRVHVVANNHFQGQAPANALQLAHSLEPSRQLTVPDSLVARFPQLQGLAAGQDREDDS